MTILLLILAGVGLGAIFSPACRAMALIIFVMFLCWLVQ